MQGVNIYIATTARGPAKRKKAYYIYILECRKGDKTVTREGRGQLKQCTENQIELTGLSKAFQRITQPCSVRVFTQCEHVLNSMNNHWVSQWEKNGWKKAGDKPVKNMELWQQLMNLMRQHNVTFTDEAHEYSMWLNLELEKMKERNDGEE